MKKTLNILAFLITVLVVSLGACLPANAEVQTGSCGDNVSYTLDTQTGELVISGQGEMSNYNNYYSPCSPFALNSSIKSVVIKNGVTSIGNSAFYNCTSLKSVTIPNSVTSIGGSAFDNCTSLTDLYYNGTVEDWFNISTSYFCSNPNYYATNIYFNGKLVTDIEIPDTIENIRDYAFCNFKDLKSIKIPDTVTSIGYSAFYGCTSLESITIPDSVTSIGYYAFYNCTSLKSITIPNSVTSIGNSAFYNCTSLTDLYYNGTVEDWLNLSCKSVPNDYATSIYFNNKLVTDIEIPDTVTTIRGGAFKNFKDLKSIKIPNSVTSICDYAFYNCTSLTDLYYNGSVEDWLNISMSYGRSCPNYYATNIYFNGKLVTDIEIPDTVESIRNGAFCNFKDLKSIKIPNSVTSIGSYTFYDCTSLESITMPNTVTSIGEYTFSSCTSLTDLYYNGTVEDWLNISVGFYSCPNNYATSIYFNNKLVADIEIPDTVESIRNGAFKNFKDLKSVTIPNSVTSIDNSAFYNCTSL